MQRVSAAPSPVSEGAGQPEYIEYDSAGYPHKVRESQAAARANLGDDSKTAASDEAGRPPASQPASPVTAEPVPMAFRYHYPDGIRYDTGGREINGCKPMESFPLYSREQLEAFATLRAQAQGQQLPHSPGAICKLCEKLETAERHLDDSRRLLDQYDESQRKLRRELALWKRSMCVLYEMMENSECPTPQAAIGLVTSALDLKLREMERVKGELKLADQHAFELREHWTERCAKAEYRLREMEEGLRQIEKLCKEKVDTYGAEDPQAVVDSVLIVAEHLLKGDKPA